MIYAHAGDVGFTHGTQLLHRAIRRASTGPREEKTWTNHSLLFTKAGAVGDVASYRQAWAIEAQWHVEENPWFKRHQKSVGTKIRIFRPTFLSERGRSRLIETSRAHLGERYGWWKLGTHLIDNLVFEDKKVLSRFLRVDSRPICSYLVARAYEVAGHPGAFGPIDPHAQDPDEMMDYCKGSINARESRRARIELYPKTWDFVGEFVVPEAA